MTATSSLLKWSVIILGATQTMAIPSIQRRQGKCLPAVNQNYTASISFLGCYTDDSSRVLQGGSATPPGGNAPQTCADTCGMSGFTYAGVEYGSLVGSCPVCRSYVILTKARLELVNVIVEILSGTLHRNRLIVHAL